jgi:hypothetical protein
MVAGSISQILGFGDLSDESTQKRLFVNRSSDRSISVAFSALNFYPLCCQKSQIVWCLLLL